MPDLSPLIIGLSVLAATTASAAVMLWAIYGVLVDIRGLLRVRAERLHDDAY